MKLPSRRLREGKTEEYLCRSPRKENEKVPPILSLYFLLSFRFPVFHDSFLLPHYRAAEYCFVKTSMRNINRGRGSAHFFALNSFLSPSPSPSLIRSLFHAREWPFIVKLLKRDFFRPVHRMCRMSKIYRAPVQMARGCGV